MSSERVLICMLAGLGDAIMATPMIRSIRSQRPNWTIHGISAIQATGQYVGRIPELDTAEFEAFLNYPLTKKFHKLLNVAQRHYDHVILPYPAARWQYHAGALLASRGNLIAHKYRRSQSVMPGYTWSPKLHMAHVVDLNAELLPGLGLLPQVEHKYSCPPEWASLPHLREHRVGFHLTSLDSAINKGNHNKAWPLERYVALGRILHERGYEISAIGVGRELEIIDTFELMCGFPVGRITGTLDQTARQLARCSAVVAHESGIAHLAAATGVPTICIFAMTDPSRFAPVGNVTIVRDSLCPPCYDPRHKNFSCKLNIDFKCVREDITIDRLDSILAEALKANGSPLIERSAAVGFSEANAPI
jgi:ADP-heptose:LPS heptosyltransferase